MVGQILTSLLVDVGYDKRKAELCVKEFLKDKSALEDVVKKFVNVYKDNFLGADEDFNLFYDLFCKMGGL